MWLWEAGFRRNSGPGAFLFFFLLSCTPPCLERHSLLLNSRCVTPQERSSLWGASGLTCLPAWRSGAGDVSWTCLRKCRCLLLVELSGGSGAVTLRALSPNLQRQVRGRAEQKPQAGFCNSRLAPGYGDVRYRPGFCVWHTLDQDVCGSSAKTGKLGPHLQTLASPEWSKAEPCWYVSWGQKCFF